MRFKHSRFSKSVIVLLSLLGCTSLSNGQCPDPQDDDLWLAESGGALPDNIIIRITHYYGCGHRY